MPRRPLGQVLVAVFAPRHLRYVIPGAIALFLLGGLLFSVVERGVSAWDGVWWVVTTVTTVGYGDVTPHTDAGRVVAIVMIVFGVGFLFLLTGTLVERFISAEVRREVSGLAEPEREIVQRLERLDERMASLEDEVRASRGAAPSAPSAPARRTD